ncbi:MAG TPA: response regulator transcription factor [Thermoleophilaceae bacterium]|jgi:two-component system response regulator MprA|nr:response regulator transcription factor [Thermoleophilaceae bacterium]
MPAHEGQLVHAGQVLVVEDDSELLELLLRGLREEGFKAIGASSGHQALERAAANAVDALVVDVGLPDADGRDVCQALRARGMSAPVLFLTARDTAADRLSGFAAGGDDYISKPFVFEELVARLRAWLRRSDLRPGIAIGTLHLDPVRHSLQGNAGSVKLSPTEFRLLAALASRMSQTLRRPELVAAGWPAGAIVHDNTLDVYIRRLRRKLTEADAQVELVTTHGVGYSLE